MGFARQVCIDGEFVLCSASALSQVFLYLLSDVFFCLSRLPHFSIFCHQVTVWDMKNSSFDKSFDSRVSGQLMAASNGYVCVVSSTEQACLMAVIHKFIN